MHTRLLSLFLVVLGLGLGTSAARAANAYAGTYTMAYMDHKANGSGQYGTLVVSSTGGLTINLTNYVGDAFNKHQALTGSVSSTGVVKINKAASSVTIKFAKQGSVVVGFTGSTGDGGVMVGLRKA